MSETTQTCRLCGRVEIVKQDGFPPDIAKRHRCWPSSEAVPVIPAQTPTPEPRAELIEAAAEALHALGTCVHLDNAADGIYASCVTESRLVLAAVLPLLTPADVPHIERQVRETVADQIEADLVGVNWSKSFRNGMANAADIARGSS